MEYKHGHDSGRILQWEIVRSHGFGVNDKWYEHKPERVIIMEGDRVKLLIQTRRPDLVVVDGKENQCFIIEVAVVADAGEKVEKYRDLRREVTKL